MESINIHIKELGRVKESQLEILPFVIFSGESGLGKSYLALLCHYFFEVLVNSSRLTNFFEENGYDYKIISSKFQNEGVALEINKSDLETWLAKDAIAYIGMMLGCNSLRGSIEVTLPTVVPSTLTYNYKEQLTGLVNAEDVDIILSMKRLNYRVRDTVLSEESPFSYLMRYELISYIFEDFRNLTATYVFPPSRGPIMTELVTPQTGMYDQFLQDLAELNRTPDRTEKESLDMQSLFYNILDGEVKKVDNKYLYKTDNIEIPISAAAASIREIAPLEMLAKKVNVAVSSILFEEPEAHLHPLKQRMMADILSAFIHKGAFMQVTTHSDYLIRRLNELILLNSVKEKCQDEQIYNTFCTKIDTLPELSLSTSNIAAYILKLNDDGSSYVVRQNLDSGVPYLAFSEAINRSMNVQRMLEEVLNDGCE